MREGSAFQARRGQKVQKDAQVGKATLAPRVGKATPALRVGPATEGQRVLLYASRRRVMQQTTPIWAMSPSVALHYCVPLQGHRPLCRKEGLAAPAARHLQR